LRNSPGVFVFGASERIEGLSEANRPAHELARSPIRDRFGLASLTDKINASLEKHFWRWASLFTIIFLVCSIARDLRTRLWFDELFTLYLAKLGSPQEIVSFNDLSPPLYPIIVHWLLPMIGNDALALRLPATLGYCAMIVCLWGFCRHRLPAAFGFAASLLTFERGLYYATEGRAYGLVLGCAAGALLCWQMAAECHRRGLAIALFAACSSLMVALHYYAIFFLVALFLAEAVRWRALRKVDFGILAAMVPAPLVLGFHYALFVANQDYGTTFWAQPSLATIAPFYARFLLPPLILGGLAFSVVALLTGSSAHQHESVRKANLPLHEWTLVAALVLMPPAVIVLSMYTTQAFIERYILWTVIGFALLGAADLSVLVRGRAAVGVALIGITIASIARLEIGPLLETPILRTAEGLRQELDTMARDGTEPIVVANAHAFMELSYYLDPPLRERLVFPLSRDLDLKYRGFDTDALTLGPLGQRGQIRVKAYDDILAENKRFVLAATQNDYLPQHLAAAGYRVTPIREATMLYEVQTTDE
jgi:hypothetical protein